MHAATQFQKDLIGIIPALRAFARQLTRNVTEADDLVQETLVQTLAAPDPFTLGSNLKAWAFTTMPPSRGRQSRRTPATVAPNPAAQADRDLHHPHPPPHDARLSSTN